MLAAYAARIAPGDPLSGLEVGDRPEPHVGAGWTTVDVRAAALNHHDIWALSGVGLDAQQTPMILGCDAAGIDAEGNEVIVHAVISSPDWKADETLDPSRSLLSERHPGTLAQRVAVPRRNLVRKPRELSFEEAACLPTAWLTAYRMLFTRGRLTPGQTVLVQGAGGGVATAAIALASATGIRVFATSRSEAKRERARTLGAELALEPGVRLPERVDAVIETVGEATWAHSVKALKPGGRIIVAGATSGSAPAAELRRVFFLQLEVVGSTMGTRDELERLAAMTARTGIRPVIHDALPLREARHGFEAMIGGELFGKIVIIP
jgi:NADPH:quinone reductase-like Zn-dependent oxidoreductase